MHAKIYIAGFIVLMALSGCFGKKAMSDGPTQTRVILEDGDVAQPDDDNTVPPDENVVPPENNGSVLMVLTYTGTVRDMSKHEGCGFMIEMDHGNGELHYLEPLTLDAKYKVDGKVINFQYTDSRRPSQCTMPSKPIVIDKIIE